MKLLCSIKNPSSFGLPTKVLVLLCKNVENGILYIYMFQGKNSLAEYQKIFVLFLEHFLTDLLALNAQVCKGLPILMQDIETTFD